MTTNRRRRRTKDAADPARLTRAQYNALYLLGFNGGQMTIGDLRGNGFRLDVIHRLCRAKLAYCADDRGDRDTTFAINTQGHEAIEAYERATSARAAR